MSPCNDFCAKIVNIFSQTKKNEFEKPKLSDQGSNLNSSGPKPDVLPVTPSDNLFNSFCGGKDIKKFNFTNF